MVLDIFSNAEKIESFDDTEQDAKTSDQPSPAVVTISNAQKARLEKLVRFRTGLGQIGVSEPSQQNGSFSKRQHLNSLQELLVSLESEIERYARLEEENRVLQRELTEAREAYSKERRERHAEVSRSAILARRINETRSGLQTAHVEVANQASQIEALKTREEQLRVQVQRQDAELRDLRESERASDRENIRLTKKLNDATRQMVNTELMLADSQTQVEDLKRMLDEDIIQRDKMNDDLAETRARLLDANEAKLELESRFELAAADLKDRSLHYEREMRDKDKRIATLEAEADNFRMLQREYQQTRDVQNNENDELKAELSAEQDTTQRLNEQLLIERRAVEAEREQMLRYVSLISEQDIKLAKLADEKNAALEEERRSREDAKAAERENRTLSQRLRKLETIEKKYERLKARQAKAASRKPVRKPRAAASKATKQS